MSATAHNTRQVTASEVKVAWAAYRLKVGGFADDIYARARMMEAALDLPKFTLSRSPRVYLTEGPAQAPSADPDWFNNRKDFGLKEVIMAGAKKVLPSQPELWNDVYQNMVAAHSAKVRDDIFGWLGRKNADGILAGRVHPNAMKSTLYSFAQKNAISIQRGLKREVALEVPGSDGESSFDLSSHGVVETWNDTTAESKFSILEGILRGRNARPFLKWLMKTLPSKADLNAMQLKVLELDMQDILAGRKTQSAVDLAVMPEVYSLGKTGRPVTHTAINVGRKKTWSKLLQSMDTALESGTDSELMGWVQEAMMRAHLRMAKNQAAKVADQFLQAGRVNQWAGQGAASIDNALKQALSRQRALDGYMKLAEQASSMMKQIAAAKPGAEGPLLDELDSILQQALRLEGKVNDQVGWLKWLTTYMHNAKNLRNDFEKFTD